VQAKIIKLVGLKNGGRLSPINLVTFAGTQNGEYKILHFFTFFFIKFYNFYNFLYKILQFFLQNFTLF
jgi:hypothetical protein